MADQAAIRSCDNMTHKWKFKLNYEHETGIGFLSSFNQDISG